MKMSEQEKISLAPRLSPVPSCPGDQSTQQPVGGAQ